MNWLFTPLLDYFLRGSVKLVALRVVGVPGIQPIFIQSVVADLRPPNKIVPDRCH